MEAEFGKGGGFLSRGAVLQQEVAQLEAIRLTTEYPGAIQSVQIRGVVAFGNGLYYKAHIQADGLISISQ